MMMMMYEYIDDRSVGNNLFFLGKRVGKRRCMGMISLHIAIYVLH